MTQSSSASEFIEHLRRAATSVGCDISSSEGKLSMEKCGPAELSLLLAELHERGYSIISSRPEGENVRLGIMKAAGNIPEFFPVHIVRCSVTMPRTDGLFLAFLGPDGVGKTTIVDRVMARLKPVFADQHLFHWRPQVIKPRNDKLNGSNGWTSVNRQADPPRGMLISLLRLGGVFLDHCIGQQRIIRPALNRGALVVFDRYYHDILVDGKRYCYGGPRWLLSVFKALLPQRKVFFVVLDADEKVILSRKQEVTIRELRYQRQRYAALARSLHCLHVRTDFGLDQTLAEVLSGIGRHLTHRFDERLHRIEITAVADSGSSQPVTVAKTA